MGKNLIHVTIIFIGGIFLLGGVARIQKDIIIALSYESYTFSTVYFIAYMVFSILGFYLVRFGYRKMYPIQDKETIEDIGDR